MIHNSYFVFLITVKVSQPFINIIEVSLSWLFVEQLGNLLTSLSTPYWLNIYLTESVLDYSLIGLYQV